MMVGKWGTVGFSNHKLSLATGRNGWLSGTALGGIGALTAGAGAAALGLPQIALANPTDGHVAAGNVNIVTVSPNQLDIVQSSKKAIINWGDFSIGSGETTNFLQPGRNSWTLNRVTGGNPSEILGSLNANGNVLLLNQNGILFGPHSRIDVGGLVASTANIKDTDFLNDRFRFDSAPQGSTVINQGHITVAEGGLAAFVAPGVQNSGVIEAKLGKVSLASGTAFTLDLYGDGLVSLALDGEVTQAPVGPDGTPLPALVTNDGRITADGGRVLLTAEAAKGVVDSVINTSGVIEAKSVGRDAKGTIVLAGGDNGLVEVSGKLNASGAEAGSVGGTVEVTGDLVWLTDGAKLGRPSLGQGRSLGREWRQRRNLRQGGLGLLRIGRSDGGGRQGRLRAVRPAQRHLLEWRRGGVAGQSVPVRRHAEHGFQLRHRRHQQHQCRYHRPGRSEHHLQRRHQYRRRLQLHVPGRAGHRP
jgi:filamentous hemagglutinin family protein